LSSTNMVQADWKHLEVQASNISITFDL